MVRLFLLLFALLPSLALAQYTPHVLWDRSGAGPESMYGGHVFPLGDQNNDGYADWMVCALGGDTAGTVNEAVFELFHGGNPPSPTPYWSFRADPDTARLLWDGRTVGDINGDGYVDWVLETKYRSSYPLSTGELWWGGPVPIRDSVLIFRYQWSNINFKGVGDINGDGYYDLCFNDVETQTARYLFGSPRPDTIVDWQMSSPAGYRYLANPFYVGDINGDGLSDYCSDTSWPVPLLYLVFGDNPPDSVPDLICSGVTEHTTNVLPDITGDGYDDIVRFDPGTNEARVRVGGPAPSCTVQYTLPFPVCDGGMSVTAALGDLNEDGYKDFGLIGWGCHSGWGEIDVFLGGNPLPSMPVFTLSGRTVPLDLIGIRGAAGLGDVNGDGVNDFVIGSWNYDGDGMRGRAVILSGDTDLVAGVEEPGAVLPQALDVSVYPNPFNSTTEIRYSLPRISHVSLKVFDVTGREVSVLVDEVARAGEGRVAWKAEGVASGVYFVRLSVGEVGVTRKVLLVR